MPALNILVIEDEKAIRDMLKFALPKERFNFLEAERPSQAKAILSQQMPDVILVDWMLPESSGVDFVKWLKAQENYRNIPIVMLTAKAEESQKIKGLESGADDYVTKPFSPKELIARIQAVLRRGVYKSPQDELLIENLKLNTQNKTVTINKQLLELSRNEYALLAFFVSHPNKTYSRQQLLDFVWGQLAELDERSVDVQIRRLRDKLKPFDYHQKIKTIRGFGYQWMA